MACVAPPSPSLLSSILGPAAAKLFREPAKPTLVRTKLSNCGKCSIYLAEYHTRFMGEPPAKPCHARPRATAPLLTARPARAAFDVCYCSDHCRTTALERQERGSPTRHQKRRRSKEEERPKTSSR